MEFFGLVPCTLIRVSENLLGQAGQSAAVLGQSFRLPTAGRPSQSSWQLVQVAPTGQGGFAGGICRFIDRKGPKLQGLRVEPIWMLDSSRAVCDIETGCSGRKYDHAQDIPRAGPAKANCRAPDMLFQPYELVTEIKL
jgi:hypothetical protein